MIGLKGTINEIYPTIKNYTFPVLIKDVNKGLEFLLLPISNEECLSITIGNQYVFDPNKLDKYNMMYEIIDCFKEEVNTTCKCDFYSVILVSGCKCGGK